MIHRDISLPGFSLWMTLTSVSAALAANGSFSEPCTALNPCRVEDYADLKAVAGGLDKDYRLVADIDASASKTENHDSGFVPIGNLSTPFTSSFHGGGHVVRGLTVKRPLTDYVGLFGKLGDSTTLVDSLGVEGASMNGRYYVGAIAGESTLGAMNQCHSTGEVSGASCVGGLVGTLHGGALTRSASDALVIATGAGYAGGLVGANFGGNLTRCRASGATSSSGQGGGLVGYSTGIVESSYATGAVRGSTAAGGLIGILQTGGKIDHCYATGLVQGQFNTSGGIVGSSNLGSMKYCYWDLQTTSMPYSSGVSGNPDTACTGYPTAYMKQALRWIGWSFADSSAWRIDEGNSYPLLRGIEPSPTTAARRTISVPTGGAEASLHLERGHGSWMVTLPPGISGTRAMDGRWIGP